MSGAELWAIIGLAFLWGMVGGIRLWERFAAPKLVVEQVLVEIERDAADPIGEAVRKGIERIVSGQRLMGAEMIGALTIPLKAEGRAPLFLIIATADLAAKYDRACGK